MYSRQLVRAIEMLGLRAVMHDIGYLMKFVYVMYFCVVAYK
jgi:hypothetical protein